MALVKLVVKTPRKYAETLSDLLFEAGAGGVEERENGRELIVYAATREEAEQVAKATRATLKEALPGVAGISLKVEVDESSDWDTAWTKHLGQVVLTPKIVIQPVWDDTPAPEGAQRIIYDPKLAFGDGGHATTRLAAAALERACAELPSARVLDFGSGTGVLAFVALLAGAANALGVDIDPVAVEAATRNAELNALRERATFTLPNAAGSGAFDIVVANVELPALVEVAPQILRHAHAAKRLILTGFLEPRVSEVVSAFETRFELEQRSSDEEWALLELKARRDATRRDTPELARVYGD